MTRNRKRFGTAKVVTVCITVLLLCAGSAMGDVYTGNLATVQMSPDGIHFVPSSSTATLMLTVSGPAGAGFSETYQAGVAPVITVAGSSGKFPDGKYTYELTLVSMQNKVRSAAGSQEDSSQRPASQSGYFLIKKGAIVVSQGVENTLDAQTSAPPDANQPAPVPTDVVYLDDVIVDGSLCVGFDCVNGESFGFDTIKLKENNLRIFFEDTSNSASFPTNDWRIVINDSSNGGGNYFAVEDSSGGRMPLKIEAGARANALHVHSSGRIGFGTAVPSLELHIKDGDTPSVRLEQDGSIGWPLQTWDMAGNEANFFIRDVTNGSKLPFKIRPGAPTNSLFVQTDGKVGFGTSSPAYPLELETTGQHASLVLERTDGKTAIISATNTNVRIGALTTYTQLQFIIGNTAKMTLRGDSSIEMANGATLSAGGVWTDASSRDYKRDINPLEASEAMDALKKLSPVTYHYKADNQEMHVGFIAEDVPDLVAMNDRKGMSPMDVVAVLTRVVQEQQKTIEMLNERIAGLEKKSQ